ncbi:hypothetical protein LTR56_016876 [Elasticomyces elasticus]|nr:hypothetical protein LTR56_016876 [Elasticomyces elasticus]KAK3658645.1 hypothetical protein LTR22_008817 [Elasticomyces elasticus]KAK4913568.1 hypothetical protein LTR49_018087 [Elasticomyces elasticus]KAK5756582.1 hypothetical protein LTS12_013298 [Elasticomyces elasticus]
MAPLGHIRGHLNNDFGRWVKAMDSITIELKEICIGLIPAMDESPLQKIPAELRNRISEMVLQEPDGVEITIAGGHSTWRNQPQLPLVCRQLRKETLKMYFAINEFTIHTDCLEIEVKYNSAPAHPRGKLVAAVVACLEALGHDNVREAAKFTLHLGEYDNCDDVCTNATYFDPVWGAVADVQHGLIGRHGLVLPIRDFHLTFESTLDEFNGNGKALKPRYHFPYGSDRQESSRCLDTTCKELHDIAGPNADWLWHYIIDDEHATNRFLPHIRASTVRTIRVRITTEGAQAKSVPLALTAVCQQARAQTTQLFYSLNQFTVHTRVFDRFEEDGVDDSVLYDSKIIQKQVSGTVGWLNKIGIENVALAKEIIINLGIINLDFISALIWVGDAWEIAAHQDQGLLDRQGPILPLRDFDVEITMRTVTSIDDNKMGKILVRYLFPYGSDRAATQHSLQETLENTKGHAKSSGLPE